MSAATHLAMFAARTSVDLIDDGLVSGAAPCQGLWNEWCLIPTSTMVGNAIAQAMTIIGLFTKSNSKLEARLIVSASPD
jgi:hypothetical protein